MAEESGKMKIYLVKRDAVNAFCNLLLLAYIIITKSIDFLNVTDCNVTATRFLKILYWIGIWLFRGSKNRKSQQNLQTTYNLLPVCVT